MPSPGKRWYHLTFGTYASWLPGDPRGFRSRNHRIHSSGDHRRPPPRGEHAGLHTRAAKLTGPTILLHPTARPIIGNAMVRHVRAHGHRTLAIAVGAQHAHLLIELAVARSAALHDVGRLKRAASFAARIEMPGRVWGRGCSLKPIGDVAHHRRTFAYIRAHAQEGAWVWTFREG